MIPADNEAIKAKIVYFRTLTALVCEPEKDVVQAPIIYDEFEQAIAIIQPEVAKQLTDLKLYAVKTPVRALLVEYARLFIGPFKLLVPPYASCYLGSKLLNNEVSDWVLAFYEKAGLAFQSHNNELPDHITIETEFLHFLLVNRQANKKSSTQENIDFQKCYDEFLKEHYLKWVPSMCANVIGHTKQPYYKLLFEIIEKSIRSV